MRLLVSTFLNVRDVTPYGGEATWPSDFLEWRDASGPEGKEVPLWSAVKYRPDKEREKGKTAENVESVQALVLDYDWKLGNADRQVTLAKAIDAWDPWEHIVTTTFSHTPTEHRFRLVVPFKRPITVPEYVRFWDGWVLPYMTANKVISDLGCRDPGRMFYLPTRRVDVDKGAQASYNRGALVLDPDALLAAVGGRGTHPAPGPASATPSPTGATPSPTGDRPFQGIEVYHQIEDYERIKEQCAFMRHAETNAATLDEPQWYAQLSILVRCKDGNALGHRLSSPYPRYTQAETDDKLRRALEDTGPFTCPKIRTLSEACKGCPLGLPAGEIGSPIQLGKPDITQATSEEIRQDFQARIKASLAWAEENLARAQKDMADLIIEEAEVRTNLKFQEKYAASPDKATDLAKRLGEIKNQKILANNAIHRAEHILAVARKKQRRLDERPEADPRVLDSLTVNEKDGTPKNTLKNVEIILSADPFYKGHFAYDLFAEKLWYGGVLGGVLAADHLDTEINCEIERRYGIAVSTKIVQEVILTVAHRNEFHPVRDYLKPLIWDGTSRLADLFIKGFGVLHTNLAYLEDAARTLLLSAVARVLKPGEKVDTVVVLVGPEGVKKSTGLRLLAGSEWFSDTLMDLHSKDAMQQLNGQWVYEMAEMDSLKKAESTRIRSFISSQEDNYRPPYGRHPAKRPRQTVLVGSTNTKRFLNDPHGSRRFVPVSVRQVDPVWIATNRDQLWAEAVVRYQRGEPFWYEGVAAQRLRQESEPFRQEDPWYGLILQWLRTVKRPRVTLGEVLTSALMVSSSSMQRYHAERVQHILQEIGCVEYINGQGGSHPLFDVPDEVRNAPGPAPGSPTSSGAEALVSLKADLAKTDH